MTRIRQVRKRDGRLVPFRREKIADAIFRAARAVGGEDRFLAEELSGVVVTHLTRGAERTPPSIEDVQDAVERVLIETGHARTAKAYILYRERRAAARAARFAAQGGARPLVGGDVDREAVIFDKARLVETLIQVEGVGRGEAEEVARAVEGRIVQSGIPRLTADTVASLVHVEMFERGRESRFAREAIAGVGLDAVAAWLTHGPMGFRTPDPAAFARALGEEVLAQYVFRESLPRVVAEAHRMGDLHLYDPGAPLGLAAVALPFRELLERHLEGEAVTRPGGPRRFAAAVGEVLRRYAPYVTRRLALEDVNVLFAPFVSHLDEDALAEEIREWLLSPALQAFPQRGGRLELEFTIVAEVPDRLAAREPPSPAPPGRRFADYADTALDVARVFVREATRLRRQGQIRGPRLTLVLPRAKPRDAAARALVREALAAAAEVGEPLVVLEESGVATRGTRWLRRRASEAIDPLRFEDGDVSVATVTALNLVAAALRARAGGLDAFYAEAERLLDLALDGAAARGALLEAAGEDPGRTLYALRRGPVPLVDIDAACHLIEPVGLDRAVLTCEPLATRERREAIRRALFARLEARLATAHVERGLDAALAEGLASEAATRFAALDAQRFPQAADWWPPDAVPTYMTPAPHPGESRREPAWPALGLGLPAFQRIRHRVDAEHRPPVDDLFAALQAAADDDRVVEYALEPWPQRTLRGEASLR